MAEFERDIAALKLSSAQLLNEDGTGLDHELLGERADQIAAVNEHFHPLVVVGSATGVGRGFAEEHGIECDDMQVLASWGTAEVSKALRDELIRRGVPSGQVLAKHEAVKAGSVLMRGIVHGMLEYGNVYGVNEDDQHSLFELNLLEEEERTVRSKQVGIDNDPLVADLTIALIEELKRQGLDHELACYMAIFTDVGGFRVDGEVQPEISASKKQEVYDQCDGVRPGGSGGMEVKAKACFDAHEAGAAGVYMASPEQDWVASLQGNGEPGKLTKVVD